MDIEILMKFVGGHPRIRRKTYNPNRPARESGEKHTIQAVRPENPEKNIQSKPSGPKIRKSEKKPTIQTVLLGWLLSTTHAEAPCGGNKDLCFGFLSSPFGLISLILVSNSILIKYNGQIKNRIKFRF